MVKVKKLSKNICVIVIVCLLITYMLPLHHVTAAAHISVSGPSIILEGQTAVFNVIYGGNVIYINLSSGDIVLNGFQASVSVSGTGNSRKIVLSNVRGTGNGRSITIASGTGYVGSDKIGGTTSNSFQIKSPNPQPSQPPQTTQPVQPSRPNRPTGNTIPPVVEKPNNHNNDNNQENSNVPEEPQEEEKPQENNEQENNNEEIIDYDAKIPIPNTGK